jgi:hypothetical protein
MNCRRPFKWQPKGGTMRLSPEQLQELIDTLCGTSRSIAECLPTNIREEDLPADQLEEIYQQIFRCETCDWWFERSEQAEQESDKELCQSCAGE